MLVLKKFFINFLLLCWSVAVLAVVDIDINVNDAADNKILTTLNENFQKIEDGNKELKEELIEIKEDLIDVKVNLETLKNEFNAKLTKPITQDYDEHFNCIRNCTRSTPIPNDCDEIENIIDAKKNPVQLLKISNNELSSFYAYCYKENNYYWTIIQRRKDGTENFYRNWQDYKYGFGSLYGEYWLGLERLHQMTKNKKYQLWIELKSFDGNETKAFYANFSIGSENENYKLTISDYSGDAGDALALHNGMKFSTYDNDNSKATSINCAEREIGAWWYEDCANSNLNGRYMSYGNRKTYRSVYWLHWLGREESLRYTHMAIRPIDSVVDNEIE